MKISYCLAVLFSMTLVNLKRSWRHQLQVVKDIRCI